MIRGIAASTLLMFVALAPSTARAEEGLPPGYVSEVLDNGLRVSILPDPNNAVVATQLWYHVGSANEQEGTEGFAHLFEHLMFGPTTGRAKDAYADHHHRHGGRWNAYTYFDETVYVSEIAPEHLDTVLALEADRMLHLVLEEQDLENEKKIVSEELRMGMENDPVSRLGVATLAAVFGEHPYAHTPGGTREDVGAATLDLCREFYAEYYKPRNAHLVIVGPVDGPATLDSVRRHFGAIPADGVTPPDVPPLTGWSFPREVVLKEDLPPAEIAIQGYPLPPGDSPDRWAIAVMKQLLGGGEVDPFGEILIRRGKVVHAETEWLEMRRGTALVFVAAHVPYRRKKTAFRLIDRTLGQLDGSDWLTEESVASAKRALLRVETNRVYFASRRADAIGRSRWWLGDERFAFDAPRHIEQVTREDVERAFRRYVMQAEPVRVYLKPERVPLYIRMFGWLYPVVN